VGGYIFFIKLPFLFMMKVNKENKPKSEPPPAPSLDQKRPQDNTIKLDSMPHQERMKKRAQEIDEAIKKKEREREEEKQRQERKRAEREKARAEEEKRQQKKSDYKKEETRKEESKKEAPQPISAAAQLFDFKPGETITQGELKKRYYELLRQNHPDKVASLGKDFKDLAEKKTKEINTAYEELKKKAS
jgi:hypothetical protein